MFKHKYRCKRFLPSSLREIRISQPGTGNFMEVIYE